MSSYHSPHAQFKYMNLRICTYIISHLQVYYELTSTVADDCDEFTLESQKLKQTYRSY